MSEEVQWAHSIERLRAENARLKALAAEWEWLLALEMKLTQRYLDERDTAVTAYNALSPCCDAEIAAALAAKEAAEQGALDYTRRFGSDMESLREERNTAREMARKLAGALREVIRPVSLTPAGACVGLAHRVLDEYEAQERGDERG